MFSNGKNKIINKAEGFLKHFGDNIVTKVTNVCSKTGMYNVPPELFQQRTSRTNRALIEWDTVKSNNITIEQLKTCEGGIVVEFINNDFFDENNSNHPLFNQLKEKLGSDNTVSSIITIRNQTGESSSSLQRSAFNKLINNTKVIYKGKNCTINKDNYNDYAIKQIKTHRGKGNDCWSGFLYVSIKGGQQDTIETHKEVHLTLFNPACEMAVKEVCYDIDLVVLYFIFLSILAANCLVI